MQHWKYKNTTFLLLGIFAAFVFLKHEPFHNFLLQFGQLGYIGAFLGGMLFVSTFTITTGALILLVLAERLSPVEIGLVAGAGAVLGDLLIFRFVKDNLAKELGEIYNSFGGRHLTAVFSTKYFSWLFPVFGAIVIASPLPDELGVSLMGISKMKTYKFILLSFILNAVGIFLVVSASSFIKP